jgi:uncharacterized protein
MPIIPKRAISKRELQTLNVFLTAEYDDAKPLNLTQAHGFLCAIASAPTMIMPSKYQPILFGGYPEFKTMEQVQSIMNITMMFYNSIVSMLSKNKPFVPLLWDDGIVDYRKASFDLVGQWCDGYLRCIGVDPIWSTDENAINHLFPFCVLADSFDLVGGLDDKGNVIKEDSWHKAKYKKELPLYIKYFYKLWREHRANPRPLYGNNDSVIRPKTGRNEACPCGSGKKFKKCCGSPSRIVH